MRFVAYYCVFYLLKQGAHILYYYPGSLNIWLLFGYSIITVIVLTLPFKPMLKALWITLMSLDVLAPLTGNLLIRWCGLAFSSAWLVWFACSRLVKTGDLENHPWRVDLKSDKNTDSP
jgi:hypothetical protein